MIMRSLLTLFPHSVITPDQVIITPCNNNITVIMAMSLHPVTGQVGGETQALEHWNMYREQTQPWPQAGVG